MRTFGFLLAASLVGVGALPAQDTTRTPTRPDSTVTADETNAEFEEWRTAAAEHGRFGASFLLRAARYQVLVLTPMAIDLLAADSLITKHTRGCQEALRLSDDAVDSTAQIRPWIEFDSAARARPLVALTILPADPVRMNCSKGEIARFAAIVRGVVYGVSPQYNPAFDATYAEVRRGGLLEPAVLLGRAPVIKYTTGRSFTDGTQQVRVYVEPEVFQPAADGSDARLELHVYSPVDEAPNILPIPPDLSRAVWQQMLPWRAMRLGADGAQPTEDLEFELPPMRDSSLAASREQYDAGEYGRSANTVLTRLAKYPFPPRRDTRTAMLQTAAVFSVYGEHGSSTALLANVMEFYPCLTLADEAPSAMRAALESVRPTARCTWVPLPLIALRSVVPGGGQGTSVQRKRFGRTLFLSTVGGFAAAQGAHAYSRSAYRDYLNNRGTTQVPAKADFNRAELSRQIGNALTIGAIGVWGFAAVEAVFMEWRHKRGILEVRDVGRPRARRAGVSLIPAPSAGAGIGFAVELP